MSLLNSCPHSPALAARSFCHPRGLWGLRPCLSLTRLLFPAIQPGQLRGHCPILTLLIIFHPPQALQVKLLPLPRSFYQVRPLLFGFGYGSGSARKCSNLGGLLCRRGGCPRQPQPGPCSSSCDCRLFSASISKGTRLRLSFSCLFLSCVTRSSQCWHETRIPPATPHKGNMPMILIMILWVPLPLISWTWKTDDCMLVIALEVIRWSETMARSGELLDRHMVYAFSGVSVGHSLLCRSQGLNYPSFCCIWSFWYD